MFAWLKNKVCVTNSLIPIGHTCLHMSVRPLLALTLHLRHSLPLPGLHLPEWRHEFQGSDTACVRRTVQVLKPDGNTSALLDHINAQVRQVVESSGELRQAIVSVDHAPTEVVLTRQFADVSKQTYHLRLNKDKVDHSLLAMFDSQPRSAVSASVFWGLTGPQPVAVHHRRPVWCTWVPHSTVCGLACLHRLQAGLMSLFEHFSMATAAPLLLLRRAYDRRTEDAVLSFVSSLPPNSGALLLQQLDQGTAERDLLWYSLSLPR